MRCNWADCVSSIRARTIDLGNRPYTSSRYVRVGSGGAPRPICATPAYVSKPTSTAQLVAMSAHDIHDDVLTAPALLYSLCVQHKLIELSPTEVDLLETALGEKGTTFALVRYSL